MTREFSLFFSLVRIYVVIMSLTDAEILDKIDDAIESVLLGKDVMFEGNRVTLGGINTLYNLRERIKKKINAVSGGGMMKSNVGIRKRD